METPHTIDEASAAWEWNSLLDFNVDDQLTITWSPEHHHQPIDSHSSHNQNQSTQIVSNEKEDQLNQESDGSDNSKIRKRDPRLTCENFLAGIIPCACPELDEKLEEEERSRLGKKRARTGSLAVVRCQVPECEIDISELKGYHRRHRVCLRCANANSLLLDGEYKRYCQQCGKFHILPDFDEGKRSCRWKLERHNNRRRRKSSDSKVTAGKGVQVVDQKKETEGNISVEDLVCDAEARKDNSQLSVQNVNEAVESEEGRISPGISLPSSQDIRSDSIKSFASGETQKDQGKDNSIFTISSSFGDNRSAYSSVCPTGRISFKLYDWNPAEFPRRLRHQIFQWLANMPVELEGYIRPGCTILTVFIPMPQFMWDKVSGDAVSYIHELVREPESMLYGRGDMSVYLNEMIFRVLKGRASLRNVKVEMRAPRLHYVHPTWFEAGKSVEFIACGSNMIQPKIRFLISFAGKYLTYSYKFAISHGKPASCHGKEDNIEAGGRDHQIYKIYIPKTEPALWGPAFVEVESELGLSNFIPILLGDAQTCSELQLVQKKLGGSLHSKRHRVTTPDTIPKSCKFFESTERAMSDLILDIAWLLKEPKLEDKFFFSSANIQRLNCLLSFLIQNDSIFILEKVLNLIENKMMDKKQPFNPDKITNDADTNLFQNYIVRAREIVHWRIQQNVKIVPLPTSTFSEVCFSQNHSIKLSVAASNNEEMAVEKKLGSMVSPTFQEKSETIPLLDKRTVKDMVQNPSSHNFQSIIRTPRPLVLVVAVAALCSGVCAVVFHPQKVGEFAVTIHHCLFGYSNT